MGASKVSKKSRNRTRIARVLGYSFTHELLASPVHPMPKETQSHYFMLLCQALAEMDDCLSVKGWNALSEMVNLVQTLVMQGTCRDDDGLVLDAIHALTRAGSEHLTGQPVRLAVAEKECVRAIAADFMEIAQVIPHRQMVQCHRATQDRINAHRSNKANEPTGAAGPNALTA